MPATAKFFVFSLIGSSWIFGVPFIGLIFSPFGFLILLQLAAPVVWIAFGLIVLYAAMKHGAAACLGMIFVPSLALSLYVVFQIIPVPIWFQKHNFSVDDVASLESQPARRDPDIRLIALSSAAHCYHGPCRELVLETSYSLANPGPEQKGWVVYKAAAGDVCNTQDNLSSTLALLQDNIFGRCIAIENRGSLADAIWIRPYQPDRRQGIVNVKGWEIIEIKRGVERKLGTRLWGTVKFLGPAGWMDVKIGKSATERDMVNAVLGLNLDGKINQVDLPDADRVLDFLVPLLSNSDRHIQRVAIEHFRKTISSPSVDAAERRRVQKALADKFQSMLRSQNIETMNVAISAVSALDAPNFDFVRDDLVALALAPPIDGLDYGALLLLLSRHVGGQEFSDDARRAANTIFAKGDVAFKLQLRMAFVLLASGGTEYRDDAFSTILALPSPRHEHVIIALSLGGEDRSAGEYSELWSEYELERLLDRAAFVELPLLRDYVSAFARAIVLRGRADGLAQILQQRLSTTTDSDGRLTLKEIAGKFQRTLSEPAR